jgi:hypothetical protein
MPTCSERTAFWLSMHVGYACRDEGACCTAGWPIPIERPQAGRVRAAIADGRLRAPVRWLSVSDAQPADVAGVLAASGDGCVFHQQRRCDLQSALGHDALPSCCQHFPRECVIDDRGVFVTLSHYCPTAAGLLFAHDGPMEIVTGPPPVRGGEAEGLDARGTLPPLLAPGVLMDLAGLSAWETHVVSWLGGWRNPDGRWSPEQTLVSLESDARALAAWRPGGATLSEAIAALGDSAPSAIGEPCWENERALRAAARQSLVPAVSWPDDPMDLETRWTVLQCSWREHASVINRFLAAHAFASWMPYRGGDVLSGVRRLRLPLAVLRAEATRACERRDGALTVETLMHGIRQTDLLIRHLIDRDRRMSD